MYDKQNGKGSQGDLLPMEFSYDSEDKKIAAFLINHQPYFVARSVCDLLDFKQTEVALRKLDDDEKLRRKIYVSGQNRDVWLVNESGLYHLIFRSNKPEARVFRKWVTSEVLPKLRKTGGFNLSGFTAENFTKGLKPVKINDLRLYPYRELLAKLGYSTRSSASHRRRAYPQHFMKVGELLYITHEFAEHLAHSRAVYINRERMKQSQPMLPLNFGDTSGLLGQKGVTV